MLPDGRMEYHEVKGAFHYDDAAVKFKCASSLNPEALFVWAKLMKDNNWKVRYWMGGEVVKLSDVEKWRNNG